MSSLIAELMRRRDSTPQDNSTEARLFASEPNFNPLAGARDEDSSWRAKPWLIGVGYVLLSVVILWQGWQLWSARYSAADGVELAVSEAPDTRQALTDPGSTDDSAAQAAASQDSEPETADRLASIPALIDPSPGVEDLPPLTPATPPEPVQSAAPSTSTAETEAPASTPADTGTAEPAATPAEQTASAEPEPPTAQPGADTAEPASRPAIANVNESATTVQPGDGSATFSGTRRNRELREAQALYQAGNIDQALAQLGAWLREDDHTDVRQYYARLLLRADQPETARYVLRPQYSMRELELRAYADFRADAFSDALRHYGELLRRSDRPQQEWYLWVAICHDNLEQSVQAISMFETYLQQTSGQPESLVRHARERVAALSG